MSELRSMLPSLVLVTQAVAPIMKLQPDVDPLLASYMTSLEPLLSIDFHSDMMKMEVERLIQDPEILWAAMGMAADSVKPGAFDGKFLIKYTFFIL